MQTRWSRTTRSSWKAELLAVALVLLSSLTAGAATLEVVPAKGRLTQKRWKLDGRPRGVAVAPDGTIYAGLTESQSVVAIDPAKGVVLQELTLDNEETASTKDFATLRLANGRLYVAQGSDESVSILSVPELKLLREIGLEGEAVRDALPDPSGRYLFILGRKVRVWDAKGEREIRVLGDVEPMAIATDAKGSILVVVGGEQFPNGRVTMIVFYDTSTLREIGRMPLQTEREIVSAFFAAGEKAIVAVARDWLGEASASFREERKPDTTDGTRMRIKIDFGDLVSSESICLPDGAGPQIATTSRDGRLVIVAEKRCASASAFTASRRRTTTASLYGIPAYAVARDPQGQLVVTDPAGYLTIYRQPESRGP